jgi:hypothetical protein
MWIYSILLIIIAGIFNACMDVLRYRYKVSIFRFWKYQNWINPTLSVNNKWKSTTWLGDKIMSTVLVWITDMWHFVKMLMLTFIFLAMVLYKPMWNWWGDVIIFYFSFTITFEIFFSTFFIKK